MEKIAEELKRIVADYGGKLSDIPIDAYASIPSPKKWSKKQILGHLIDSAQTNTRRFIIAQYEDSPEIIYNQEKWVELSRYQEQDIDELIALWVLVNNHICFVLSAMDQSASERICKTNNQTPHDLQWLAQDYIKHLLHHLHQILDLTPVAYP
jgi:DinB superfamily